MGYYGVTMWFTHGSQVSASEFSTGFVGQTAAKTRDIFDSARGAVLFIDEAYRLYDPLGRSYMQV